MVKMLSTLFIIPALLFYFLLVRRTIHKQRKLPPGPPCLPVIGNLHMLGDLVYRSLKELSDKYGPIISLRFRTTETLVISSSEAADLVFKTYDLAFSSRPSIAVGKAFPEKMEEFKHIMDEVSYTMGTFYMGDFIPWLGWLDIGGLKRRMNKARQDFDDFIGSLLRQNEGSPPQRTHSFIDAMLKMSKNDGVLRRDCIKAIVLEMSTRGTQTTGAKLEWAVSLLVRHPHCVLRLQHEIGDVVGDDRAVDEKDLMKMRYLQSVVKESMRLYTVVPLSPAHESSQRVELPTRDGHYYEIEKGTGLIANMWAIGRDPRVSENAEEFHPERFMDRGSIDLGGLSDMKSIPFGVGRRVCRGIAMAIPTILLVIARLFHEFDWTVDGDSAQSDMSERMGITISKKRHLFATPKLRYGAHFCGSSGV